MKIKSPLVNKKEVKPLVEAGADEFFCGIKPIGWRRKFRDFSINQRSTSANFTKFADLEKAIVTAHRLKAKVHVAINAFLYMEEQCEYAIRIIEQVLKLGADGIIFADLSLLINTPESLLKNKDIVIGTDAVVFNHEGSNFYKKLGATRIVIPRAVTIDEVKNMVTKDRSVEYEVFIIHDLCFFIDGFCAYCKEESGGIKKEGKGRKNIYFFSSSRLVARGFLGGCRARFKYHKIFLNRDNRRTGAGKDFNFWANKHIEGCGICAIYDFKNLRITSLKVLDRDLSTEGKIQATLFTKKAVNFLKNTDISKNDYTAKCRDLFKKTFKVRCNPYDCYYPSAIVR